MAEPAEMPTARRTTLTAGLALFAAVILIGGYGAHWHWIGINGRTVTLWDWLQLLLLPMAVAVLPIWLSREAVLERRIKRVALAAGAAFVPLVLASYLVPWRWTGFPGNTLWDWLNLVALPVAVTLIGAGGELSRRWSARSTRRAVVLSVPVALIVLAGYMAPWPWTGFTGNTLWNWLHLLLLPLLLPTVIVPALRPLARARMTPMPGPGAPDVDRSPAARRSPQG